MENGDASTGSTGSRWSSPRAVTAYVLTGVLVVVGSFWAARAGRADEAPPGTSPSGSPSAPSAGTPRFTIALVPAWNSAPDPAGIGATQLVAEPAGMTAPFVLAGSPGGGYSRLDPTDGGWSWTAATQSRPFLGWAGSTAVFGGDERGGRWLVLGVDTDGSRAFSARSGAYVTSTPSRVVLAASRSVTGITPTGQPAWRSTLPAGVTAPGDVAGYAGPAAVPGSPAVVVFSSLSGPGRVATLDVVDGTVRSFPVAASRPHAWSTAWGVLVADPSDGSLYRYDSSGSLAWSREEEGLTLLGAEGDLALVGEAGSETVSLVRLQDGSTVWTSDPLDATVATGTVTATDSGQALVSLTYTDPAKHPPVVIAADPTTGEQLWAVERRSLLGTWRGFALFAETDGRALSALDLRNGISFATLNAVTVVQPELSALVGSTLVYIDPSDGTAHGVALSDRP